MENAECLLQKIESDNLWTGELELKRNELLLSSGKIDSNLYFIVSGSLRLYVSEETEEHTIRFGYKSNFITALDSFITDLPTNLNIAALKKTMVKVISKHAFFQLINSSEQLTQIWTSLLQQLILQQLEREQDILTTSPLTRYKRVLKRSPQLFQEIPNKYIADYLRMTPETLSRIKNS
jgi:CRP-like cAMP-binding protein